LEIDSTSTLLGLKFKGLTTHPIHLGLFALNLYMLIHFLWCAWDSIVEWKLRVTSTIDIVKNTWIDEIQDITDDSRQSTLPNRWLQSGKNLGNLTTITEIILGDLKEWMEKVPVATESNDAKKRQVF